LSDNHVLHKDDDRGPPAPRDRRRGGDSPRGTPPRRPPLQGGRPFRTLAFWAFVALLSLVAFRMYQGSFMAPQRIEISYTRFIQEVDKGNIQDVQIIEKMVTGDLRNESTMKIGAHDVPFKAFKTNILGDGSDLPDKVWKSNPGIEVEVRNPSFNWVSVLVGWLPVVFVLVLWLFMVRQVQSGGSAALKFGKTKARVLLESTPKVTFKDVAGCDEAKQELQEVIEFLKEPQKFQRLGGRIPKGALLLGPPGSGKTLLAKAVAGEAGVPFFSMSGSDFVEMFVGVGASRVRDLFEQGKRNAPCLTGDAVVTLSGGKQITIQEMFENAMVGVRVPAMVQGEFRFEDANVIGITRKRCTDLYEVTTAASSIKATGNHLFPVLREHGFEWVRVDELREGECVAAPRLICTDSDPPMFTDLLPDETLVHFRGDRPGTRHARLGEVRAFRRGNYVSMWERGDVTPSRGSLQGAVAEMEAWSESRGIQLTQEAADLRDLTESAVIWSRIEGIKRIEPVEFVYDLCLDRHNCFIANNLVVHNCIVFVDEIDAVGRHRGAGLGGGHDEREQTLNQLLVEMDGFESNEGVIMIAATNRPDVLDPALLRPGRFDRQIVVDWPDVRGREGILRVHTRKIPLADDVDLKYIARGTPGLAGADLANIVNEAALLAARRNRKKVMQRDFEDAKDKVMLGMERRSLVMTEDERRSTAYHEAGHALVGWLLPGSDPVNKVTIIPRGRALGITSWVPQEERHNRSKEDLERMLCHMMGGRAAELLVFNHLTTGAISDIEQATETARNMVCRYGMSEALGPLTFGKKEEMVFLGKEIATHKDYSEQTAVLIDQEVRRIIETSYNSAMQLLRDNMDKLHLLANTLLEREVLDGDEMDRVLHGEKLPPMRPAVEPEAPEAAATSQEPAKDTEGGKLGPFPPPAPRPAGA
jgi:ATP-dependent metalloprotease FtsH